MFSLDLKRQALARKLIQSHLLVLMLAIVTAGCSLDINVGSLESRTRNSAPFLGQLKNSKHLTINYPIDLQENLRSTYLTSSGEILVATFTGVLRLLPNGNLKTSFAKNGFLKVSGGTQYAMEDAEGRVLALQYSGNNSMDLARYNANGTEDKSFAPVNFAFSLPIYLYHVVEDATGYYVVGKIVSESTFKYNGLIYRVLKNGNLDSSFGTSGQLIIPAPIANSDLHLSKAYVADAGSIFIVGENSAVGASVGAIMYKVEPTGVVDTAWGSSGYVTYNPGGNARGFVDIQIKNGKIHTTGIHVAAGKTTTDAYLCRFNMDGSLDTTFNSNGVVLFRDLAGLDKRDFAKIAGVDASGNVFAYGFSGGDTNFFAKVLDSGSLDASYGNSGLLFADFGHTVDAYYTSALLLPDGSLFVGDNIDHEDASSSSRTNVFTTKILPSGIQDSSYGVSGIKELNDSVSTELELQVVSSQMDADGNYFILSYLDAQNSGSSYVVQKVKANGDLDTSFANQGYLVLPRLLSASFTVSDGLYIVGNSFQKFSTTITAKIYKFDLQGNPASSFGTNGVGDLAFNGTYLPRGNYQIEKGADHDLYVSEEIVDTSDDSASTALWKINSETGAFSPLKIISTSTAASPLLKFDQDTGKIYVLAISPQDLVSLYRLNDDLTLDLSFNSKGYFETADIDIDHSDSFNIQDIFIANKKLYLSILDQTGDEERIALLRLTSTGSIDTSWSADGRFYGEGYSTYSYDQISGKIYSVDTHGDDSSDEILYTTTVFDDLENPSLASGTLISRPASSAAAPLNSCRFSPQKGLFCIETKWSGGVENVQMEFLQYYR